MGRVALSFDPPEDGNLTIDEWTIPDDAVPAIMTIVRAAYGPPAVSYQVSQEAAAAIAASISDKAVHITREDPDPRG